MKGIVEELFNRFYGGLVKYSDMDTYSRMAVDVFFKDEHENRVGINKDSIFAYICVPTQIIAEAIMSSGEYDHFGNFDKYHNNYMLGGDVVKHRRIWPIIIDNCCDDLIFDGWHRFHWYYEKNLDVIPCIALIKP